RTSVSVTGAECVGQRGPEFVRALPVVIMNARYGSRIHLVDGAPEPAPAPGQTPTLADRAAEMTKPATPSLSPTLPNKAAAPIPPSPKADASPPAPGESPSEAAEPAAPAAPAPFTFSDIEPREGSVHRALSELAALRRDGLVNDAEFEAKRAEILRRLWALPMSRSRGGLDRPRRGRDQAGPDRPRRAGGPEWRPP